MTLDFDDDRDVPLLVQRAGLENDDVCPALRGSDGYREFEFQIRFAVTEFLN